MAFTLTNSTRLSTGYKNPGVFWRVFMTIYTMVFVACGSNEFGIIFADFFCANFTNSMSILSPINIISFETMASYAISFAFVLSAYACSSQYVFFWSHCFKVVRIYTSRISTKMVYMKAIWNRTFSPPVGYSMGRLKFLLKPKNPVLSFSAIGANPKPASLCLVDFFPKSFLGGFHMYLHGKVA